MSLPKGDSYMFRVRDINEIYDEYAKKGLPNRTIWLRYIYPKYHISERAFYKALKTPIVFPSEQDGNDIEKIKRFLQNK